MYGGEEFLVILNKCDASSAPARAENLRAAISTNPIHVLSNCLSVSISIGMALSTDFEGRDFDEIIREADAALYAAKAAGRNCMRIANREPGVGSASVPRLATNLTT